MAAEGRAQHVLTLQHLATSTNPGTCLTADSSGQSRGSDSRAFGHRNITRAAGIPLARSQRKSLSSQVGGISPWQAECE